MIKNSTENRPKIKPYKSLRNESYRKSLRLIRTNHKRGKNTFSKVLHANGMDSLHEYLSITLVHPKIILSGVTTSLLGEVISVSIAEIFGYEYNYLLFIYYFAVGYLASIIYLTLAGKLNK